MTNSGKEYVKILLPSSLNQFLDELAKQSGRSKQEIIISKLIYALEQEHQTPLIIRFMRWIEEIK